MAAYMLTVLRRDGSEPIVEMPVVAKPIGGPGTAYVGRRCAAGAYMLTVLACSGAELIT